MIAFWRHPKVIPLPSHQVEPFMQVNSVRDQVWDDLIVLCAANSYDGMNLADKHIAEQLSRLTPVLYVDPPVSGLTPLRNQAAGRGVVGTDLPAIRWLATDLVAVAAGPGAFADHVDRLMGETRSPALMAGRRAFAARHAWSHRAAEIHEALL